MYQFEIEQPSQMGMRIQQTISHVPNMCEQRQFPVAPEAQCEEKKIVKGHLMENIKGLMCQVQEILLGQDQQCGKTQQEELLRQIKDLQCQVRGLMLNEKQEHMMPQCQKTCEYPMHTNQIFGEYQPMMKYNGEKLRQMMEKLIQQCKILEDMFVEKQCQIVYQMPKMEKFYFDLEMEMFEQIKKRCIEIEQMCCDQGMEQGKMFVLMKQFIQQIEEILYPINGMKTSINIKEQCERMLEKFMKFRCLLEQICFMICPETFERRRNGIEMNKMYNLINWPIMCNDYEICNRQPETIKIDCLRRELEEIKMAKQQLEMKLNETNRRVEQFKCQIERLEKMPRKQNEQYRCEFIQCSKPEEELTQICMKPIQQQQQPAWYIAAEPKCEMMIKSRINEPRDRKSVV